MVFPRELIDATILQGMNNPSRNYFTLISMHCKSRHNLAIIEAIEMTCYPGDGGNGCVDFLMENNFLQQSKVRADGTNG